jgi:hypothetical protein
MCLIVHKPAHVTIDREFADDVYTRNADGFGIIYHEVEDGKEFVKTYKLIGSRDDVWAVIQEHQHRELLIHWRMRTHGDIDLENCHPYALIEGDGSVPSFMMHNGILQHGNAADTKKSDTWHYIRDTLRPLLMATPDLLESQPFRRLVEADIGSNNKFAIMDVYGKVTVLNRRSGIEWGGMWLSNTYAWSAYKFGAVKPVPQTNYASWTNSKTPYYSKATDYIAPPVTKGAPKAKGKPKPKSATPALSSQKDIWDVGYAVPPMRSLFEGDPQVTKLERNDVYDLLHDFANCMPVDTFRLVTPELVLDLVRDVGFDDACYLPAAVMDGKLTPHQAIQALKDKEVMENVMYGGSDNRKEHDAEFPRYNYKDGSHG